MAHVIEASCDGCSACARQCPTRAITGERGGLYRIEPSLCIDCSVCGMICHVEAVIDAGRRRVARLRRDERPRPVIDAELCNGCDLCVQICPFDSLSVVGPQFQGIALLSDPGTCVACGDCARVCIKDAILMTPLDLRSYLPEELRARWEGLLVGAGVSRDR